MCSREMKDSGIEWIGYIPNDWYLEKLKNLYSFEKGKNAALYTQEYIGTHKGEYPVYSGQTENDGIMGNIDTYDYEENECLFTTTVGAKVMTPRVIKGKFSLSQNCLIMKSNNNSSIKFIYYMLNPLFNYERALIPAYMQPSLRVSDLCRYQFYVPNIEEQQQIVNYLDQKVSQINDIISKQKILIEKYKAYKQSLITETVTKGLNKNVPMKDSGIEWIGEIPSHWNVKKMKYLGSLNSSGVDKKIRENEKTYKSVHYVNVYKNGQKEIVNSDNYLVISCDENKATNCTLVKGDVLFTNSSETAEDMGASTVVAEDLINTLFGYHLMRFRPYTNILWYKYEKYLFSSNYMRKWFEYNSVGITRFGLAQCGFSEAQIIYAPYEEQKEIANFLDKKCNAIDSTISKKEQLIEKLKSYKKSLIYECVTGKREVN